MGISATNMEQGISMFHRAFFNSIIDKHQHMHFTLDNIAGVRGDHCGAVCWTAVQHTGPQRSPRTPATSIAATTPGLIFRILNSVFLNNSVNLTRYRPTP